MVVQAQRGKEHLIFAPQAMTNSATVQGNLDTFGGAYATIRVAFASEINTNAVGPTIELASSNDTVATNFATIVANRTTEDLTAAKALVYHVDCRSQKRYLRVKVTTATATNDNVTLSATGTITRLAEEPAGTTGMAGATTDVVVIV